MADQDDFPQSFICPLTLEVMNDPVVDSEGNSFEREAITNWLLKNSSSPVTRNSLKLTDLVPNRALLDAINEYRKAHNLPIPSKAQPSSKQDSKSFPDGQLALTISEPLKTNNETAVMFTIRPPSGTARVPVDICAVIDISGSMGTEAKLQNAEGKSEAHGLSILDIVLHAVRTIIHILSDHDRLSLVVYSTTARTLLPLTYMTESGKKTALGSIANLVPEDQTNLWDGLIHGLDILSHSKDRIGHILLLTDGQPNVIPPRGHIPMLQRYKDQHGGLPCSIHTFGFGYNLDSSLLRDLASMGNGSYAFIPDSGMVGTVFVNMTSNILVTMATNVTLKIEGKCKVLGGFPAQYTSWGAVISVGNVQFDQEKNIVVTVTENDVVEGTLSWVSRAGSQMTVTSTPKSDPEGTLQHYHRLLALDWIRTHDSLDTLPSLLSLLTNSPLLPDLTGQVTEALSRQDWYSRWGVHYLPSLLCAHLLQQCNNFKDPGIQNYGGKLFQELRDKADDIFVGLPPPKPSAKPRAAPIASMRTYHSAQSGCFGGKCLVAMETGQQKRVDQLKKGDIVFGGKTIVTVIKYTGTFEMVEYENLEITPYHPISLFGKWKFPIEVGKLIKKNNYCVYNFVLDSGHILNVEGIECVTLGHGIKGDSVVEHEYFGSEKVVNDLKKMKGWNEGLIELDGNKSAMRDEKTNLIVGFVQEIKVC